MLDSQCDGFDNAVEGSRGRIDIDNGDTGIRRWNVQVSPSRSQNGFRPCLRRSLKRNHRLDRISTSNDLECEVGDRRLSRVRIETQEAWKTSVATNKPLLMQQLDGRSGVA